MISPLSTVKINTLKIGKNTNIWQYCVVLDNVKIGSNSNICSNVFIDNNVSIGNNVTIKNGSIIFDGAIIEDDVFIGPNVTITNDISPRSKKYPEFFSKTLIKKGVSLGANSTIIAGITIDEYSMIGAGSILTKNVGIQELWYGNPAILRSHVCKCGLKCSEKLICDYCIKKLK